MAKAILIKKHEGEFAAGSSLFGAVLSGTGVVAASFAVLLQPISNDYGWNKAQLAFAITLMRWAGAVSAPVVGYLVDKFGARAVVLPIVILSSAVVAALALANGSLLQFYLLFAAVGLFSPGIAPYSKVLASWYQKNRGLALGSFGVGVFICMAAIPQLSRWLLGVVGWKEAFIVFSIIILVISFPLLWFFFRERPKASETETAIAGYPGFTPADAWKTANFWFIVLGLGFSIFTFVGLQVHDVLIFKEKSLSLASATNMVSLIAIGGMAAQVIVGYLLDKYDTPKIIVPFAVAALAGLFIIHEGNNIWVLSIGSVLLGLGSGGETSMTSYYVTRFFGMRHFSKIYTSIGLVNTFIFGFSPVFIGWLYDKFHTYQWGLVAMEGALALAVVFYSLLGQYRFSQYHLNAETQKIEQ